MRALYLPMSTDPQSDPNYILQELENAKQVYSGGNYAAAEPMLRAVFEKLQFYPDGMAYCAESLSEIYTAWGKFSEAIKLNQRFINVTAPLQNHNVVAIGSALERIAAVSLKVGKQEQSEKLLRLAASVKAGKVDVTTLVTDKGKVPDAPPTTEHTYTFRALSPDSPPPPEPAKPAAQPDVLAKPVKETAMFSKPNLPAQSAPVPPAPPSPVPIPPPQPVQPQPAMPASPPSPPAVSPPAAATGDVLSRPIKETAMFSRPSVPPQGAIPAASINKEQIGDVADFADFDEEIPVDANSVSGTHAAVPAPPVVAPSPPQAEAPVTDDWSQMEGDTWGEPAEQFDDWGTPEPEQTPPAVQSAQPFVAPQPEITPQPVMPSVQFNSPSIDSPQFPKTANFAPPASDVAPGFSQSFAAGEPEVSAPEPQLDIAPNTDNSIDSQKASSTSNAATSARSIRSMSSRNMAAPPVASGPDMGGLMGSIASMFVGKRDPDQPVQQLVDPSTTSAKAAGALVMMAALVIGGFYCLYNFIPRKLTPEQAFLAMQHKYISVDSAKTFNLLDESTCEFTIGENKLKARLRFYLDDWRDAVDLSLGKAGQKQFCMYKTDDGLVDEDDAKLYLHGGPEIQIANKLDIVGQYAGLVFTRTKKYPASGTLIGGAADLQYLNPYSKKKEVPTFHSIVVGKGITVSLDADHARTKFYDELLSGAIPKDTPKAHPGEIRCYAVDFLSPRGTIQAFIVQLIGKDGLPIRSAKGKMAYLYALEDGKEYKPIGAPSLPYNGEQGMRPIVVWLLMDKLDSNFVLFLTMAPVVIFTILSFIFLVLSFLIPKGFGRAVAVLLLAACAIPALTFCCVKFLP